MRVLAIAGYMGSGKNTVADIIQQELERDGYKVRQMALADRVREYVSILDPIVGLGYMPETASERPVHYNEAIEQLGYTKAKVAFPELRRQLQVLGTELFRDHVHKEYWVNALVEKDLAQAEYDDIDLCMITDVRFPNEAEFIYSREQAFGYKFSGMRVHRPGVGGNSHSSENPDAVFQNPEIKIPMHSVHNTGSLEQLRLHLLDHAIPNLKEYELCRQN